jgi:hypothetical protein
MNGLEPIINLLVFLTALSVAAERITNVLKLRNDALRVPKDEEAAEKQRERGITVRGMIVGVVLAVTLKADLISALHRLDAPWETLGWVQMHGSIWTVAPEARSVPAALYSVFGAAVTGAALGFGSKFWHEMLDAILELRNMAKLRNERTEQALDSGDAALAGGDVK